MKLHKRILSIVAISMLAILCFACESSDDNENPTPTTPTLLENYFLRGNLDGTEMNIELKVFNSFVEPASMRSNGINSQTDDDVNPEPTFCYGLYGFGIFPIPTTADEDRLDAASMAFYRIPVGNCTLENELIAMQDFLSRTDDFTYRNFYGNHLLTYEVGFEYFPKEFPNGEDYFSSRFGDNTDATFSITAVEEIETGVYIVEGTINCKLYGFMDPNEVKVLQNGQYRIKIANNLDE